MQYLVQGTTKALGERGKICFKSFLLLPPRRGHHATNMYLKKVQDFLSANIELKFYFEI